MHMATLAVKAQLWAADQLALAAAAPGDGTEPSSPPGYDFGAVTPNVTGFEVPAGKVTDITGKVWWVAIALSVIGLIWSLWSMRPAGRQRFREDDKNEGVQNGVIRLVVLTALPLIIATIVGVAS